VGAVVGGAFFGDNLSFISDTTIVATRSQGVRLSDKFRANIRIALPAAVICFALYCVLGHGGHNVASIPNFSLLKVVPYLAVLVAAVLGVDVMLVLLLGNVLTGAIGLSTGSFDVAGWFASMAKGVCYARNAKLLAVPTLQLLCVPLLLGEKITTDDALLCPMLDARRMEVYAALYNRALKEARPVEADIVEADTYKAFLDQHPVYFFGNGANKCKAEIVHPNAHFIDNVEPLAKNMTPLAEKAMAEQRFEDVAYFVPFYLKDFVAKAAKPLL